jgi:hypothetical protein
MAAESDEPGKGKVPEPGEEEVADSPEQGDEADFVYDEAVMGRPLRVSGVKLVGGHPVLLLRSYVPLVALCDFVSFWFVDCLLFKEKGCEHTSSCRHNLVFM